jgi:hypothetical protein
VDVAYKVITATAVPDHSTIAEFRQRHERALGEVFVEVSALCQEAGLGSVGVVAIDGTKIRANASRDQNRSYASIVGEILGEAERTDREEDERRGRDRGDELPERFRSRESRRVGSAEAKQRLGQQLAVETATNTAYESYRVNGRDSDGRRLGARPKPFTPPVLPKRTVNLSDPDSRAMRTQGQPTIQGYNAQAAVTAEQIIVAAEITTACGPAGSMTSCAGCSPAIPAASSTDSANRQSSRCSGTPNTTASSGSSDDEADRPSDRNGASSPPRTTSSSFTTTGSPHG